MKPQSNYYHTSCQHNSQESQTPCPYQEPLPPAQFPGNFLGGSNRHRIALRNINAVVQYAVAPSGVPAVGGDVHRVALNEFAYVYAVVDVYAVNP